METPIAEEAAALLGDCPHALAKVGIVRSVVRYLMVMRQQPMALHAVCSSRRRLGDGDSFPLGRGHHHFFRTRSFQRCPAWRRPATVSAARVLILERLSRLPARPQPTEPGLLFVGAGVADAMFAAQIGDRHAGLMLFQDPMNFSPKKRLR